MKYAIIPMHVVEAQALEHKVVGTIDTADLAGAFRIASERVTYVRVSDAENEDGE